MVLTYEYLKSQIAFSVGTWLLEEVSQIVQITLNYLGELLEIIATILECITTSLEIMQSSAFLLMQLF